MAYRLIPNESARTAKDAEAFVVADTGGQVIPTGQTEEIPGGWRVEVFASDGRASAPVAVFPTNNCLSQAEIEEQIKMYGDLP